jgi:hypothetical protein
LKGEEMGLFDSVWHDCTCGESVEFQSKALPDCYLRSFPLEAVPIEIAHEINGEIKKCKCGKEWQITASFQIPETVQMKCTLMQED